MSPIKITEESFVAAVEKYADSKRVNPNDGTFCVYVKRYKNGRVSHCLIGQVLVDHGVDPAHLDIADCAAGVLGQLRHEGLITVDDDVIDMATDLQMCADGGPGDLWETPTWRNAIAEWGAGL